MGWFLEDITTYYVYLSSLLILWGIFAIHALYEVISYSIQHGHFVRRLDILYMCGLTVCTTILLCCLFLFTHITTQYIFQLFMFEVWYFVFAIFFTCYLKDSIIFCERTKILDEIRSK